MATDGGSYAVDTAALTDHASRLTDLAGQLGSALANEQATTVADDAFGQTCQPFTAALRTLDQTSQGTLQAGVTAMDTASTTMQNTVANYEQQETTTAAQFAAIGRIESDVTPSPVLPTPADGPPAGEGALTS